MICFIITCFLICVCVCKCTHTHTFSFVESSHFTPKYLDMLPLRTRTFSLYNHTMITSNKFNKNTILSNIYNSFLNFPNYFQNVLYSCSLPSSPREGHTLHICMSYLLHRELHLLHRELLPAFSYLSRHGTFEDSNTDVLQTISNLDLSVCFFIYQIQIKQIFFFW